MTNVQKLLQELKAAGIETCGCNSNGVVWDDDNNEIQDRPDVKAIIAKHDPTPIPVVTIADEIAAMKADIVKLKAGKVDKV